MLLWKFVAGNASSAIVANGVVYFYSGEGIYALDAGNGGFLWGYAVFGGPSASTSPVVANGMLYAVGQKLYAFHLPGQ